MVSLDAFSLFTSVPLDKILCIILEKPLLDKSHRELLPEDFISQDVVSGV